MLPRKSDVEDDTTATTMEAKPKTIEERITKFIVKELPQTEGDPNYVGINKMIQGLYGNVAILPTTLGGGRNRHVGLITKETLYATLLQTAWVTQYWSGADCADDSQHGTKAKTTGRTRRETKYLRRLHTTKNMARTPHPYGQRHQKFTIFTRVLHAPSQCNNT